MEAGGMSRRSRTVAHRYAPLLAILATQFLLVVLTPGSQSQNAAVQEEQATAPTDVNRAAGASAQAVPSATVVPRTGGSGEVGPAAVSGVSPAADHSGVRAGEVVAPERAG